MAAQTQSHILTNSQAVALLEHVRMCVVDDRCWAASHVPVRPSLAKIHGDLCMILHNAVDSGGSNVSQLLIGTSGVGKTLVGG